MHRARGAALRPAGQLALSADAPAPHCLRQLSAAAILTQAGRTLSVEKKKTDPECGFGEPMETHEVIKRPRADVDRPRQRVVNDAALV